MIMPSNSKYFQRCQLELLNIFVSCSKVVIALTLIVQSFFLAGGCYLPALAAEDLSLRPGLSFNQDIDSGFPIVGKDMDDATLDQTKPTFVFFGASGDLNTNRQAKRVVDFYHKINAKALSFVIIDVDHPANDGAKTLIKSYYKGYIPSQVLIDKSGKVVWNQTGETDLNNLKAKLDKGE
jgi:hypothetical protein